MTLAGGQSDPNADVGNAAKSILDKFQWGLFADTPKEVRDRIDEFRTCTPERRQLIVMELFNTEPVPFRTIRKLLNNENNADRRHEMFVGMYRQTLPGCGTGL